MQNEGRVQPGLDAMTRMMYEQQIARGKAVYERLQSDTRRPREVQERLLFDLLDLNKDTPFGKEHHFADIKTIEDYKRLVPLTTYDDYAGYVYEVMEHGTDGVICAEPVVHFSETSGTMGNPKGIPYTQRTSDVLMGYGSDYCNYLIAQALGPALAAGRKFSMMECRLKTLKGGATYGALSSKGVFEYRKMLPLMTTSPEEAVFSTPDTDTRYLHARFLLAERDVRLMTTTFISLQLDLFRYIEDNWRMLVDDIERGVVHASVQLPPAARASLEARLRPLPERAFELRELFEAGFDEPFVKRAWPNMAVFFSVAGAGFAPYAERIRAYIGDVPILCIGYSASEGMYSVPFELDNAQSVLIPEAGYLEFVPLELEGTNETVGIEELEEGRDYEVIVTNLAGLYRYKMRDAIRVVGFYNKTPKMKFLFRIDQTVNMKGEKTTELVLRDAAERVAKRCALDMVDFSVYPDLDAQPPRYEFLFELRHPDRDAVRLDELSRVADEELRAGNADMEDMRADGTFAPTSARVLQEETNLLWRDMRVMRGAAPNQIKPVHVIDTEQKRRFFYALIDDEFEDAVRR